MKAHTRVCSYDRAGYGWSNPGPALAPRTSEQITRELETLMGVAEDYIWQNDPVGRAGGRKLLLCGHSMAGFHSEFEKKR